MNIQESNKLIAEFMEWSHEGYGNLNKQILTGFWNGIQYYQYDDLKFHKSWDWLMIVIEKIMEICFNEGIDTDTDEDLISWFYNIRDQIPNIESTYNDVVNFIQWYNKQQTKL